MFVIQIHKPIIKNFVGIFTLRMFNIKLNIISEVAILLFNLHKSCLTSIYIIDKCLLVSDHFQITLCNECVVITVEVVLRDSEPCGIFEHCILMKRLRAE
jgi:hypothetical protein